MLSGGKEGDQWHEMGQKFDSVNWLPIRRFYYNLFFVVSSFLFYWITFVDIDVCLFLSTL